MGPDATRWKWRDGPVFLATPQGAGSLERLRRARPAANRMRQGLVDYGYILENGERNLNV